MRSASNPVTVVLAHSRVDDVQAGVASVVLASLGLALLHAAGLTTGGTPGLAFLLSYATGWPLGVSLFAVNLPFYGLAWKGMGARFTVKTLTAVVALGVGVEVVQRALYLNSVEPGYAAVAGGVLIGTGLLVLFRPAWVASMSSRSTFRGDSDGRPARFKWLRMRRSSVLRSLSWSLVICCGRCSVPWQ